MRVMPKLLVIEDNRSLQSALFEALKSDFEIDAALTGKSGIYKSDTCEYDAIILDLNLPDVDGLAVCQQLRERGVISPVLILSAETKVLSKINLLDAGADDYMTKPFSLGELKARLRVLLRSQRTIYQAKSPLAVGDLLLDPSTFHVSRDGIAIDLRRKEFALLECLMLNAGQIVSRDTLTEYAWNGSDKPWANTIDVHIKYLRDKIDKPFSTKMINTVHGIGYKLVEQPSFAKIEA